MLLQRTKLNPMSGTTESWDLKAWCSINQLPQITSTFLLQCFPAVIPPGHLQSILKILFVTLNSVSFDSHPSFPVSSAALWWQVGFRESDLLYLGKYVFTRVSTQGLSNRRWTNICQDQIPHLQKNMLNLDLQVLS